MGDYNLDFGEKVKEKIKEKVIEDSECPFCHKIYKARGLNYHIRYCKENPDHETHCGNKGATKGKTAWNKGLTAETNESVKKQSLSLLNSYKTGKIISAHLGTHNSEE